jgi:large subunit ribosomal protein L21
MDKAMFAVVRTGGKQYRVAPGDKIVVEKLAGEAGQTISLGDVLLAGEGSDLQPTDGLTVSAEIIAQAKGDKVIVFKKRAGTITAARTATGSSTRSCASPQSVIAASSARRRPLKPRSRASSRRSLRKRTALPRLRPRPRRMCRLRSRWRVQRAR